MNFWLWATIVVASLGITAMVILLCWQSLKGVFTAVRGSGEKMRQSWGSHFSADLHPITPPEVCDVGRARLRWQENKIERLRGKNLRRQKYRKTWQKWLP